MFHKCKFCNNYPTQVLCVEFQCNSLVSHFFLGQKNGISQDFYSMAPIIQVRETSCYFCMCMHFACCILESMLAKDIGSRLENGVLTCVTSHGPVFIFDPVIMLRYCTYTFTVCLILFLFIGSHLLQVILNAKG